MVKFFLLRVQNMLLKLAKMACKYNVYPIAF